MKTITKQHSRDCWAVMTSPGVTARKMIPSSRYCTAYFAITIFRPTFEMEYGTLRAKPETSVASMSPRALLSAMTFLMEL